MVPPFPTGGGSSSFSSSLGDSALGGAATFSGAAATASAEESGTFEISNPPSSPNSITSGSFSLVFSIASFLFFSVFCFFSFSRRFSSKNNLTCFSSTSFTFSRALCTPDSVSSPKKSDLRRRKEKRVSRSGSIPRA